MTCSNCKRPRVTAEDFGDEAQRRRTDMLMSYVNTTDPVEAERLYRKLQEKCWADSEFECYALGGIERRATDPGKYAKKRAKTSQPAKRCP